MDNEVWRWIWLGVAVVLGVGEMATAGFFLLPFAVGAVVAAVLAWLNIAAAAQWVAFIGVSVLALVALRKFVPTDEDHPAMGANRFLHARATVIEDVERASGAGRVRVETEEWRATTDGDTIPIGTEVRVTAIRGARLVVEPVDED